jgi:hypothetical protein
LIVETLPSASSTVTRAAITIVWPSGVKRIVGRSSAGPR